MTLHKEFMEAILEKMSRELNHYIYPPNPQSKYTDKEIVAMLRECADLLDNNQKHDN